MSLEEQFLQACKSGNLMLVMLAIIQKVDVNHMAGWGLRRAIRYNHPQVWKYLLSQEDIQVNIVNESGQTALHTACRFNISEAVSDLLEHSDILLNKKSELGSSPIMVAVKYGRREALEILVTDDRVDLETVDTQERTIEQVVGVATNTLKDDDKSFILERIEKEKNLRKEHKELVEKFQNKGNSFLGVQRKGQMNLHISEPKISDAFSFSISESILDEGYFTE